MSSLDFPKGVPVLVTGGAGFIGSHLVEALLAVGARVRVLDNFATGRRENLAPFMDRIELVEGSVADPAACARACEGARFVLHQAAIPSVPRSVRDPIGSHEANVTGTMNVLEASRAAGVARVVYAASSSAYGNQQESAKHEAMVPMPLSPYAAQKLAGEHYCRAWTEVYGLETVTLRYFNVFGPRQDPKSEYAAVLPRFITAMLAGRRPVIYGDGHQSRDFTFVANNVGAVLRACIVPGVAGQVFNVACGASFSLLGIVAMLNRILGTELPPEHEPARAGDVRHSLADISRARSALGYEVSVPFEEGLRRTVEWYRRG